MGLTSPFADVRALADEARHLRIPDRPRRRKAADEVFRRALDHATSALTALSTRVGDAADGLMTEERAQRGTVELPMEIASLLFAAGAPAGDWCRWARQVSGGLLLSGDTAAGSVWAVLSRDDRLITDLPAAPAPGELPSDIIWWLATSSASSEDGGAVPRAADEVDAAWGDLSRSIPARDHEVSERSLRIITEFWMAEDEDWIEFHPRSYPDFEPELCAAVALAERSGWHPHTWSEDALLFVAAGMADASP